MQLQKIIEGQERQPNCDLTLGLELKEAKDGKSLCIWKADEQLLNGNQVIMGGFITSAADIAMAYAIVSLLKDTQSFSSISINSTFHRPAFVGEITVTANIKKFGRKVAYADATLSQNNKVIADVTSSIMIHD
ncbi:PaaI family thioesterase [Rummeliibacillus pycnus]|uniref:PaaI family thioesterase n=1 Tax=Rummeliibacillus pycnus TaxID=101070 RepID=UPI0037C73BF3